MHCIMLKSNLSKVRVCLVLVYLLMRHAVHYIKHYITVYMENTTCIK